MFGVFMKRWKPKRTSNADRNESPEAEGSVSPEPPDRPPGKARQVHPEEKTQVLAYDSTYRKKNKPKTLPLEDNQMYNYNHLANTNVAMSPVYPLTPNICVEGGKIEFIKSPPGSARSSVALVSPPQTPLVGRRGSREKRDVRIYDEPTEKFDGDKELLERRIKQLESQLEEERSRTQRERMAVTKLQNKLIKLVGIAMVAIGVAVLLQWQSMKEISQNLNVAPWLFIVLGSIVFVISFFGCCGAIRESHCMVVTYAIFLIVIIIVEVILAVCLFVYTDSIKAGLKISVENAYKEGLKLNPNPFYQFEQQAQCCGSTGPSNYVTLQEGVEMHKECCPPGTSFCNIAFAYSTGCTDKVLGLYDQWHKVIAGVAIGVACVEVVGALFALCLANSIRNMDRRSRY